LVLFTEPDFEEAFIRLMKRSAYVLIPFSVLLVKYYLGIGRKFDEWSGVDTWRGVAQSKNMLGSICMILGFFFIWHFLQVRRWERTKVRRNELLLIGGFLLAILWLSRGAHSATSTICWLVG